MEEELAEKYRQRVAKTLATFEEYLSEANADIAAIKRAGGPTTIGGAMTLEMQRDGYQEIVAKYRHIQGLIGKPRDYG